jgi:hypothetical protein
MALAFCVLRASAAAVAAVAAVVQVATVVEEPATAIVAAPAPLQLAPLLLLT